MLGRRALVTGASGYVGGSIAASLIKAQWEVLTAGRNNTSSLMMDFSEPSTILQQEQLCDPVDICIHVAAAHEIACAQDPILAMKINVLGTRALVEWCIAQRIRRFVYISTFHVFGSNHGELTEAVSPQPLNDYGLTHLLAEEVLLAAARRSDIKVTILRPSNLIGAPADWSSFNRWTLAPFDFCRQAAYSGQIVLRSSGKQTRNWVEIDALCASLLEISEVENVTLLHVSGSDLSIIDLAKRIADSWQLQFGQKITIDAPDEALPHPEPSRNFTSIYRVDGFFPNIDEFVLSAGTYLQSSSEQALKI